MMKQNDIIDEFVYSVEMMRQFHPDWLARAPDPEWVARHNEKLAEAARALAEAMEIVPRETR